MCFGAFDAQFDVVSRALHPSRGRGGGGGSFMRSRTVTKGAVNGPALHWGSCCIRQKHWIRSGLGRDASHPTPNLAESLNLPECPIATVTPQTLNPKPSQAIFIQSTKKLLKSYEPGTNFKKDLKRPLGISTSQVRAAAGEYVSRPALRRAPGKVALRRTSSRFRVYRGGVCKGFRVRTKKSPICRPTRRHRP